MQVGEDRESGIAAGLSFSGFYEAELDRQVRRAFLMVSSNELANDIVHDAMVQLLRRWGTIANPGAYLNLAVLNGCRDAGRRRASGIRLLSRIAEREANTETRDVLDDVLRKLPSCNAARSCSGSSTVSRPARSRKPSSALLVPSARPSTVA